MKVSVTYTLNELQRITPNLRKEHFYSDCPKVKEALKKLFWNLGCTLPNKVEIDEGVITMNRFKELDDSIRITVSERVDIGWLKTRFASHQVRCLTDDVSMMRELDQKMNQRSFDITTGTELV